MGRSAATDALEMFFSGSQKFLLVPSDVPNINLLSLSHLDKQKQDEEFNSLIDIRTYCLCTICSSF